MALSTNIALIDVDNTDVEVGLFSPYSEDLRLSLAKDYSEGHFFRRSGDSLQTVRLDNRAEKLGERFITHPIRKPSGLSLALLEEGLARELVSARTRVEITRRRPLQVLSIEVGDELCNQIFPGLPALPLVCRKSFVLAIRSVSVGGRRRMGMAINPRLLCRSESSLATLVELGFDPTGLYVRTVAADSSLGRSQTCTVGQIAQVRGEYLILGSDRRHEKREYSLAETYLEVNAEAQQRLLTHFVGETAPARLRKEIDRLSTGKERLRRVNGFLNKLKERQLRVSPGVHFRFSSLIEGPSLNAKVLRSPTFVMGPGTGTAAKQHKDIFRLGPRQRPRRELGSSLQVCFICEEKHRGEVEVFLNSFDDGLGIYRGVSKPWRMPRLNWQIFPSFSGDGKGYERAIRAALDSGTTFDLVFVQTPLNTENLKGAANPYLVVKAKCLGKKLPVQAIKLETIWQPTESLQWSLGALALQIFSKLGGIPWLLEAPESPPWELIFGLGSAQVGTGKFNCSERVVGLCTAFSADGSYWLTEASRVVPFTEHEAALAAVVSQALKDAARMMGWRSGEEVRLTIHSFKPFRRSFAEELTTSVCKAVPENPTEVSLVHVAENHELLLFDKGKSKIPQRGHIARLSGQEALIAMLGSSDIKRKSDAVFPRPLLLKLHSMSSDRNITRIAEQTLAFASQSWRNFGPTGLPVTLAYPRLIAKLLSRLGDLESWDPDTLRGQVGATRWFL